MRPPILTISPWTGGGANGSVAKSRHKPPAPGGKRPGEHRNVASCGWAKGTSRADRRRASNPGVKPIINGGASEPAGPPGAAHGSGGPGLAGEQGEQRCWDSGSWSFTQSPSPGYLPPPPNVALAAQARRVLPHHRAAGLSRMERREPLWPRTSASPSRVPGSDGAGWQFPWRWKMAPRNLFLGTLFHPSQNRRQQPWVSGLLLPKHHVLLLKDQPTQLTACLPHHCCWSQCFTLA
nr:transmembrane protein 216 isoform X2 [Caretta caretta]